VKTCTTCGETKEARVAFFFPNKMRQDGLENECRECRNRRQRAWTKARRAAAPKRDRVRSSPFDRLMQHQAEQLNKNLSRRARLKGVPLDSAAFSVVRLRAWLVRQPECSCCARPFRMGPKDGNGPCTDSPSLDRLDPSAGYVPGNVSLICFRCNRLKCDATADELRRVATWMDAARLDFRSVEHA
jgi:hypothetical protein